MKKYSSLLVCLLVFHITYSQPRNIPDYVPHCGLVAWYPFSGNAIDSSGSRHNGIVNGAALTKDRFGVANSAYYFNGSSYIIIPADSANRDTTLDIDGSITISAWVKSKDYSRGQEQIFWRGDAAGGYDPCSFYVSSYSLGFRRDIGSSSTTEIINYSLTGVDTMYHHIVATFDSVSGDMKIYFDATLVSSANKPGTATYATTTFWNMIGAVDLGTWQYFLGTIDDVGVWNRALTKCEIGNLYYAKNICNCFGDSIGVVVPKDSLYIVGNDTGCRTYNFTAFTDDTNVISYSWNFGDGATATGNPINHAYLSGGTYTVVVTTTNRSGKKVTAYHTITINASSIQAFGDTTICVGSSVQLGVSGGTYYSWSPSTNLSDPLIVNPVATPDATITYVVTGTDNMGCPGSDSVKIIVIPLPTLGLQINDNYQNCETHGISLIATGATKYVWTPSAYLNDSTSARPIAYLKNDAVTFHVTGTDSYGCTDTASIQVSPHKESIVSLPDAFSPNGDGANDILYVRGANVSTLSLTIYNRWGQKVFETSEMNKGWDGTLGGIPQPVDTYVYIIKISTLDGCDVIKKGNVSILR